MPIVKTLIAILLLKAGPQDLPYSSRLMLLLVLAYIVSGVLVYRGNVDNDIILANMIADVLVMLLYTHILLQAFKRKPRFIQSASAMLGVGILFHLMSWPLLLQTEMVDGEQMISTGASLLMLMLISWALMVNAHIYREALETGLGSAILLSFSLFFISLAVSRFLLPQP